MNNQPPSRRIVLRSVLALGCSVLAPLAFFSAPARSADSGSAAPTKKAPKPSVQYQTQPKGEQKCGDCANFFAASSACKLVEGQISPKGWCSLWTKKA